MSQQLQPQKWKFTNFVKAGIENKNFFAMIEFSFSHYYWNMINKITEDKDIIPNIDKTDFLYLTMIILPNGETLLHKLADRT